MAYISNTKQRDFDPLRFFRWRNYLDYGTGMSGDLFVHLFSSLHFITNSKGPDRIASLGGLRYWKDGREVPDVLGVHKWVFLLCISKFSTTLQNHIIRNPQ